MEIHLITIGVKYYIRLNKQFLIIRNCIYYKLHKIRLVKIQLTFKTVHKLHNLYYMRKKNKIYSGSNDFMNVNKDEYRYMMYLYL